MHIQQGAAGTLAVHEPVFPGVAVDIRGEPAERGGTQFAERAGFELFIRIAVFGPGADAHAEIQERFGVRGRGFDPGGLFEVPREGFFGENMFAGGQRGHNVIRMIRGRATDVHDIHGRILDQVHAGFIHIDPGQVQRLGIVRAADVAHDFRNIAFPFGGVYIRQRDHVRVLHRLIDPEMGASHKAQSDHSNSDFSHLAPPDFKV